MGIFITLEGPEGSGKSTQASMLSEYLQGQGKEVVRTREPGGVSIAEQLRDMLLNPDNVICPRAELMLYAAGRAQHTSELIRPALDKGKFVVCERYIHASVAYQGYGRGLDIELITYLNSIATGGLKPDLTIILDIDVSAGLDRVASLEQGFDRLEQENITFHEKVRQGYLQLAENDAKVIVIDTNRNKEKIHAEIINILREHNIL